MKEFKVYLTAFTMSFTFSCIFYLLFSYIDVFHSFDENTLITMLFVSLSITTLIFLSHRLTIRSSLMLRVSECLIIVGILLIAGRYFGMFPFTPFYITAVVSIGLLTYTVVLVVSYIGDQASAKKINSVIQSKTMEERQ